MSGKALEFAVGTERLAVARYAPDTPAPDGLRGTIVSVTRTPAELSVLCAEDAVPDGAQHVAGGWISLSLTGPFDLDGETGILAAFLDPLAAAGVGIFAVSTYDTDVVLVHERDVDAAVAALTAAGHVVA